MRSINIYIVTLLAILHATTVSAQIGATQPIIERATVNVDNTVTVLWMASSNLNVVRYNIYMLDSPHTPSLSYQLVGYVDKPNNSVSSFQWTSPNPIPRIDVEGQAFGVAEVYANNTIGPFSYHFTTSLFKVDVDTCLVKATLHWTRYRYTNSDLTVDNAIHNRINQGTTYKVFWRKSGDPLFAQWSDERLTDTVFTTPMLEANTQYEFRINAVIPDRQFDATSNVKSATITSLTIPATMTIPLLEVLDSGIKLTIDIDNASELRNYSLKRSDSPTGGFIEILGFNSIISSYIDKEADATKRHFYKVEAYKDCIEKTNAVKQTNVISNIHLEASTENQQPLLGWTAFGIPGVNYNVIRKQPDNQTVATLSGTSFKDNITSLLYQGYDLYCYQISGIDADGNRSISNTSCTIVSPSITMPNAIDPTSSQINPLNNRKRSQFGPALDIDGGNYGFHLEIFNRLKVRIFESKKAINEPISDRHFWDGTYQGKIVEPGSYVYTITMSFKNSERKQKGIVNVIY